MTGVPVHGCPVVGSHLTSCCGVPVLELPRGDRMSVDRGAVTCTGPTRPQNAEQLTMMETAPCGCRFGTDEVLRAFLFEPCAPDCELFLWVRDESVRRAREVTVLDLRP